MEKKHTVKTLKMFYYAPLLVCAAFAVMFETGIFPEGMLISSDKSLEFILSNVMILLTLCAIPIAVRFFKFKKISEAIAGSWTNLRLYGIVRINILTDIVFVNLLLYYMYMNVSFGYLSLITLLAMAFVYPSESRCMSEVGEKE